MNNLNLIEIFSILIIHFIGDFVLQTDKQAKGKSKNWRDLLSHTLTYSGFWLFIGTIWSISSNIYTHFNYLFDWWIVWKFSIITFIFHTITDYFTSRLNSKLWTKGDVHNFFVSIGFDQILHYVQLFLTYQLLKITYENSSYF
jgi:hypothetical protein